MSPMFLIKQLTQHFVFLNFVPQEFSNIILAIMRRFFNDVGLEMKRNFANNISELLNLVSQKGCCCEKYIKSNVDADFSGLDLEMNTY